MLNRVVLIGRLTKDPELRYTPAGNATCSFTLACDRPMKNAQGEKETDFINCEVPPYKKQLAEISANFLAKGKLAAVDGRIQVRSYTGQDGQKRWVTEVIAEDVRFLSPKDDNAGVPAPNQQQQPHTQPQYSPAPYQQPQQNYQPQNHQQGQQPPGQPSYPGQFAPPGYTPLQQQPQGQWQAPPHGYQQPHPNMPNPNYPPQQPRQPQWLGGNHPQNPPGAAGQQLDLNQIGKQVNLGDDIPF